jgi:hypothetical protein
MARFRRPKNRAALRAKARRPQPRGGGRWFTLSVTVVVVIGVVGTVLAAGVFSRTDSASAGPQPPSAENPSGDHWHAALGAYVCGEWLPNPPEFETRAESASIRTGIHTHGDGFIHIHPFFSSEAGGNATLGRYLENGGWSASTDELTFWTGPSADPTKTTWKDGDRCPDEDGNPGKGAPGRVVFEVNCVPESSNPAEHRLADQQVITLAFVARGDEVGPPPNASLAPDNDGVAAAPIDQKSCRPSAENNPGAPRTPPASILPVVPTTQP